MTSHYLSRHISSAFTLIELLVVISIISLLSSVIFATGSYARARSTDAAQAATMYSLHTATAAYTSEFGVPPPNYNTDGDECDYGDEGCDVAFSDEAPSLEVVVTGQSEPVLMNRFQASMNVLAASGYLVAVPESANRNSPLGYFNFGDDEGRPGAVLFGALATHPPTTTGESGSCRFNVDDEEEESMSSSAAARFIAGLTAQVAHAADFFQSVGSGSGSGLIYSGETYELGEGVLEFDASSLTLIPSRRFQIVAPLTQITEYTLIDGQPEALGSQCLFDPSCSQNSQSNALFNDDNIEIPTCSSEVANRSYCLCM